MKDQRFILTATESHAFIVDTWSPEYNPKEEDLTINSPYVMCHAFAGGSEGNEGALAKIYQKYFFNREVYPADNPNLSEDLKSENSIGKFVFGIFSDNFSIDPEQEDLKLFGNIEYLQVSDSIVALIEFAFRPNEEQQQIVDKVHFDETDLLEDQSLELSPSIENVSLFYKDAERKNIPSEGILKLTNKINKISLYSITKRCSELDNSDQ